KVEQTVVGAGFLEGLDEGLVLPPLSLQVSPSGQGEAQPVRREPPSAGRDGPFPGQSLAQGLRQAPVGQAAVPARAHFLRRTLPVLGNRGEGPPPQANLSGEGPPAGRPVADRHAEAPEPPPVEVPDARAFVHYLPRHRRFAPEERQGRFSRLPFRGEPTPPHLLDQVFRQPPAQTGAQRPE